MASNNRDFVHGESFAKGVMMNNDDRISIAIRKKDGDIGSIVKIRKSLAKKHRFFNLFLIRGIVKFFEGSFNQFYAEEQMKEIEGNKKSKESLMPHLLVFLTLILGIILYFIVPTIIALFLKNIIVNILLLNFIEGCIRLIVFFTFFILFTSLEKTNKTAIYHGAEHKTLWTYRKGEEINLENVRKHPVRDPSCGTGVLFFMIVLSIPFYLFLNYENMLFRIIIIIVLLPIIIGLAFEIILWLDRSKSRLAKIVSKPSLFLQRFNTREPDDKFLEVAIVSLKNLLN
jgi:uncharacterized protein YqhQ